MATLSKGVTFGATDTVTNTKLNNLVDNATISAITQADLDSNVGLVTRSTTAPSDTDSLWYDTTNKVLKVYNGSAWAQIGAPADSIFGLNVTNNSTDAINDIDISTGSAMDATNALLMTLGSAFVKQIDVAFAEGTAAGGRDSSDNLTGAKWFYVYLIGDTTSAKSPDVFISTSASPTLPTGWDVKRRIATIRWDGSKIALFSWSGNGADITVEWDSLVATAVAGDTTPETVLGNTAVDLSSAVPGSSNRALIYYLMGDSDSGKCSLYIRPTGSTGTPRVAYQDNSTETEVAQAGLVWVFCDSSQSIDYAADSGDGGTSYGYTLSVKGYVDSR